MKHLMILFTGLLIATGISTLAQAQTAEDIKNGTNNVKLLMGSTQAAVNFGVEYERRTGTFGLGAMLMHSTKNSDANKPESTTWVPLWRLTCMTRMIWIFTSLQGWR
ncbi:hypothetical protein [Bdellovibrio bacteriovorus]|uniref:hypothetical protein n=1 Tax=Bdellovibrio bacteriovorus TaxID=959 RepID=UPI0035A611F5